MFHTFSLFRCPRLIAALLVAWVGVSGASAQPAFESFDPNADGNIYAIAVQPDGKIVVGGGFSVLRPNHFSSAHVHFRIARINIDGSVDTAFTAAANGDVNAIALQPDGKILIGGRFSEVSSPGAPPQSRNGIARLNADGTVDATFTDPNLLLPDGRKNQPAPIPLVRTIAVQSDGKILIGGAFAGFIGRLNADGTRDAGFTASVDNVVQAIALQNDGAILVGGGFSKYQPSPAGTAVDARYLLRLQTSGALDPSFTTRADNRVLALTVAVDGKIVVAGEFFHIVVGTTSTTRTFVARLLADGSLDSGFDPGPNAAVESVAVQNDGSILFGGRFGTLRPNGGAVVARSFVMRAKPDGSIDPDFIVRLNAQVAALATQSNGSVLIGGYFTSVGSRDTVDVARGRLARVLSTGILETEFNPQAGGSVRQILRDTDNSVIVMGAFSTIGGVNRTSMARVDAEGRVDPAFYPVISGTVVTAVLQSDRKIVVGGSFNAVNGVTRAGIARLNSDGTLDTGFDPRVNGTVSTLLLLADGKILVGGNFTSLQPGGTGTAVNRTSLARLNAAGTVDEAFQCDCDASVLTLVKDADNSILVGGEFINITPKGSRNPVFRRYLARIDNSRDGTLVTAFEPRPNNSVRAITLQSDGKILIGGQFTGFQPPESTTLIARQFLARISSDGKTVDAFEPNPNNVVSSIAVMPNGTIVAGGFFTSAQPAGAAAASARAFILWLEADGKLSTTRTFQADAAVWTLLPLTDGRLFAGGDFGTLFRPDAAYVLAEDHFVLFSAAADAAPDATFIPRSDVGISAEVNAIVGHTDNRILIGGAFSGIAGLPSSGVVRLAQSGAADPGFAAGIKGGAVHSLYVREAVGDSAINSGPLAWVTSSGALRSGFAVSGTSVLSGAVEAVLVLPDGRLLLGGSFSVIGGAVSGNLVRLNADGTLDTGFNPAPNGIVRGLALDSSGKILVGGAFTKIFAQDRTNFARISLDGAGTATLDALDLRPNNTVVSILPLPDSSGDFMISGDFTTIRPHGATDTVARAYVARMNSDGTIDTAFAPTLNGAVYPMLLLSADKLLVAGNFTLVGTVAHFRLATFNPGTGAVDTAFTLAADNVVQALAVQGDGKILVGGSFTAMAASDTATQVSRFFVARFSIASSGAGTLDDTFVPNLSNAVRAIAVAPDQSIYLGGSFTRISNGTSTESTIRRFVARLSPAGVADDGFNPQPSGAISTILVRPDSSVILGGEFSRILPQALIYVGGDFTAVGTASLRNLVRLNDDGSADPSYLAAPNGAVYVLAGQIDGGLIVAGDFTQISGTARGRLARYDAADALDAGFAPSVDGPVFTLGFQSNGSLVLGGRFANVAGSARQNVARISSAGALDAAFAPSVNGDVTAVVVQPDGKILLAGAFTTVNSVAQPYVARLNADGSLDGGFRPVVNGVVNAIALQSDGAVQIGGAFTQVAGIARARFAILTAAGALDPTVNFGFDGEVRALKLLADGRTFAGGRFNRAGNRSRFLVARIGTPTVPTQTIAIDSGRTTINWANGGSRGEFAAVRFAVSTDLSTWTDLGVASRTGAPGGWRLTGLSLPANQLYYVRARVILASSRYYSTGRFETIWQFLNNRLAGPQTTNLFAGGSSSGGPGGGSSGGGGGGSGGGGGGGGSGGGGGGGSSGNDNPAYHLINFSVRSRPNDGQKLIAGFVLRTPAAERILVRGVGPGLSRFDVSDVMHTPLLQLYQQNGQMLNASTAWGGDAALAQLFQDVGAFAFDPASADAAQAPLLAPGVYTTHLSPSDGVEGIALAEVYFVGSREGGGLANLSARGPAGAGDAVLIIGFVVGGDAPRRFLIRGVGPSLIGYDVADAIMDPSLVVYDVDGAFAENNDWGTQTSGTAADIASAAQASNAFALPSGSRDAALVLTLTPGVYTAHVFGPGPGTGLVEVYELP